MAAAPDNKNAAKELGILYPERQASIAGVALTMREHSFRETLQQAGAIAALTEAMTDIAMDTKLEDVDSLRVAFSAHWDSVIKLIALACDQPESWVSSLSAQDGERLFLLWWSINADFFLSRVLLAVQLRGVRKIAGATSMQGSSQPGIAPATSGATPTVN